MVDPLADFFFILQVHVYSGKIRNCERTKKFKERKALLGLLHNENFWTHFIVYSYITYVLCISCL